ncbi:MAG TPA: hypothetical protein VGH37_08810 [Candidatus Acidoferrum sp.]
MKFQNYFRMQLMVVGFGAALLLASSVPAQEIDNTVWDDTNATVTAPAQPAPQPIPNDANSTTADSGAINLAAMNTSSVLAGESSASQWTPTEGWMVLSLLICIALVALRAFIVARRPNQNLNSRTRQVDRRTALS